MISIKIWFLSNFWRHHKNGAILFILKILPSNDDIRTKAFSSSQIAQLYRVDNKNIGGLKCITKIWKITRNCQIKIYLTLISTFMFFIWSNVVSLQKVCIKADSPIMHERQPWCSFHYALIFMQNRFLSKELSMWAGKDRISP